MADSYVMPGIEKAVWLLTATRLSLCTRYSDVDSLRLGIQQGKDNFIYDVGVPPLSGELVFEANKCVEDHTVFLAAEIQGTGFSFQKQAHPTGAVSHLQFVQAAVKMVETKGLSLRGGRRPTWQSREGICSPYKASIK